MFTHAFIEEKGNGVLWTEEKRVVAECVKREIPYTLYTSKRIQRRQLPLSRECFICGDMNAMHGAMKQLEIAVPEPNDFPECLSPYFHRRVWKSTLGALTSSLEGAEGPSLFAKPAGRRKLFTGRVFSDSSDLCHVSGFSRHEPIWCSDVVSWTSEFRIYVIGTDVVAADHYSGDAVAPDMAIVREAIHVYRASGLAPAAYGIDFGLLDSGETALIEANDGYSLGAYQIEAAPYTDLLFTRWRELVAQA